MQRIIIVIATAGLVLAGCGQSPPVDPVGLTKPAADLRKRCPPLVRIPACEMEAKCRSSYYARSRMQYATCADRVAGLQRYIDIAATK